MSVEWKEYGSDSLLHGGGADLSGPDLNYIRKDVVAYWDMDHDLVEIRRLGANGSIRAGYIAFNRKKGMYHWYDRNHVCKEFNPNTGKLGKTVKVSQKLIAELKGYEKREAERMAKYREKEKAKKMKASTKKRTSRRL